MKYLFSLSLILNTLGLFGQQVHETRILSDAHHENYTDSQTAALLNYWRSKQYVQPTQRNVSPVTPATAVNSGFENGDFTGWTGFIGDNMTDFNSPLSNLQAGIFSTVVDAPLSDANARHTIVSSAFGADPFGGFQTVPSNLGNYVARMGGYTPNYQGEILEQNWLVDPGQPAVKINYAVVLNHPPVGHSYGTYPYFRYVLLDSLGDTIAQRLLIGSDSIFLTSAVISPVNNDTVRYLPWTTDSVNLTAYIGQNITIRFIVAGCSYSGHFGYCYIDVDYPYQSGMDEDENALFSIGPNPTHSWITIDLLKSESAVVNVYSVTGELLQVVATRSRQTTIELGDLSPGVYIIEVVCREGISSQRIVVE